MTDAATADHVQNLRAQITGLEEDLRTATRALAEFNAVFTPGHYRLVPTLTSVSVLCGNCPDDDLVGFLDSSFTRPDVSALADRVREHHRRFHQEQPHA
jgi:translation elongation factor EF-G